jgi:hypothetical protein
MLSCDVNKHRFFEINISEIINKASSSFSLSLFSRSSLRTIRKSFSVVMWYHKKIRVRIGAEEILNKKIIISLSKLKNIIKNPKINNKKCIKG